MKSKICCKCNKEKTMENFSLVSHRNKKYSNSYCVDCVPLIKKEYRERRRLKTRTASEKTCSRCNQILSIDNFKLSNSTQDGYFPWCKTCSSLYMKVRKDSIKLIPKSDTIDKKYCSSCKLTKPREDYGRSNIQLDGLSLWCKECLHKQYIKTKEQKLGRKMERLHEDPTFRLIENIRGRMKTAIKNQSKSASSKELLGCTGAECMDYLEKLFWPGMTRANYGKHGWVIDHIVPIAVFDKTDPDWQFKAFHYTNLQPLWSVDNDRKNDRLDWTPAESKFELPDRLKSPVFDQEGCSIGPANSTKKFSLIV